MTRAVLIIFCVIATVIRSTEQLTCGPNEDLVKCPAKCLSDYCPKHAEEDRRCEKPKVCGEPKCKCGFNMRRAENGACISTRDCPPFPCTAPNTEYVSCPSYCPTDDCSQATPDGSCPIFGYNLIVVECFPQCRCISGYWKNNGTCVPYSECPQNKN
ncbi:unnamed protein product [Arctia plantaginis]|uniref:TIL domain-containing protein n=1 Tax=Arctia plantaginis TaxID=874455 RepID=A0A8S1AF40_ARCPL|nr:unnamed protein product [Arctia plantaginis]